MDRIDYRGDRRRYNKLRDHGYDERVILDRAVQIPDPDENYIVGRAARFVVAFGWEGNDKVRGQKHTDETRSAALAALLEGQGVAEVARKYKLPKSTVMDIKKHIDSEEFAQVRSKKQDSIAALIEGHLQASLTAATNIAKQTANADWLTKQDADKLGVFYGILTDKSVRILEAAEASTAEEEWPDTIPAVR